MPVPDWIVLQDDYDGFGAVSITVSFAPLSFKVELDEKVPILRSLCMALKGDDGSCRGFAKGDDADVEEDDDEVGERGQGMVSKAMGNVLNQAFKSLAYGTRGAFGTAADYVPRLTTILIHGHHGGSGWNIGVSLGSYQGCT